jgi:hypothetical protein
MSLYKFVERAVGHPNAALLTENVSDLAIWSPATTQLLDEFFVGFQARP